ncbi:MAG: hypothetical protein IJF08_08465, partial [Clostridia bacterium]|nr:hypothetical protein [Clostridia bacterium]
PLPPRGRLKMATPKRIPEKGRSARQSLLRWRRGTAAEAETSSASFDDAVAVDEIHHTTALTHHKISEKNKNQKIKQTLPHLFHFPRLSGRKH